MSKRRHSVNIALGAKLRRLRLERAIKAQKAADKIHVQMTSLLNIEKGRQNINAVHLVVLARLYGVNVCDIFEVEASK